MVGTTRFYELYEFIKRDCYDEFTQYPTPVAEAMLFRETLRRIPIEIKPCDLIAGWYGYETMPNEFKNAPDPKVYNEKFIDYSAMSKAEKAAQMDFYYKFATLSMYRPGHTCVKYADILEHGLNWYKTRVISEIAKSSANSEKAMYLNAMLISLEAAEEYAQRFTQLARELCESETDPARKARLKRIYKTCSKVPMQPADDFYEAIQSIWLVHTLTPISDNDWYSISMGRVDQFLLPYYEKSIAAGESDEDIKAYIKNIYNLLDNYGDPSCAINLGGLSPEGEDQFNHLSELFLDVQLEAGLRSPLLAVRLSKKTPDDMFMRFIDKRLFEIGKPTFYNEEACRAAMMYREIPENIAANYSVSSCMAMVMSGYETSDMWGCIYNMHLPLELTVNRGRPFKGEFPFALKTNPIENVSSMDELLAKYEEYFREILTWQMYDVNLKTERHHALNFPNAFLSVLTEGCIEKGVDRMWGPPYRTTIVEPFGLVNVANALCAVQRLVFESGKYSLDEYVRATINDFANEKQLLFDIKSCEKYGQNRDFPDTLAVRLFNIVEKACKDLYYTDKKYGNEVKYVPSLHTLDVNVQMGQRLITTMDGRPAGSPVAKNAGPTNDVRRADPTSFLMSASKFEQYKFTGGNPIDVYFDKRLFADDESRRKIAMLLRTYFDLGGMQVQVNSVDSETLKKAYEAPDDYNHVIVKIGGYSMRFNDMTNDKKLELIERIEREEGIR